MLVRMSSQTVDVLWVGKRRHISRKKIAAAGSIGPFELVQAQPQCCGYFHNAATLSCIMHCSHQLHDHSLIHYKLQYVE